MSQDVLYWLERLRNWQEKYNPVSRRASWSELDGRHINAKSEVQLAGYPDNCFLFRLPEASEGERHLPIRDRGLDSCWCRLLEALEVRLADCGETHRNGAPIRFLPPPEERNNGQTTLFPLHSLRVSLITALALEGQVPFPVLQKLVGHSRLLMTLYYTKPGATHIRDVLLGAAERLETNKEASVQNFLLNTAHDELLQKAICNSVPSLAAAIPQHPAARNAAAGCRCTTACVSSAATQARSKAIALSVAATTAGRTLARLYPQSTGRFQVVAVTACVAAGS